MEQDLTYSIKEMITEFRTDVTDKFTGVYKRLDGIDLKVATANGRTSKLEMKHKVLIACVSLIWTISMALGGVFARLYVADVALTVTKEQKDDIIRDTVAKTISAINLQYNLNIKDPQ